MANPTLTVWAFHTPEGADNAQSRVQQLEKQGLIKIHDAATVSWPADKKKPKTRQLYSTTSAGAASGGFWGLLFGILFLVPLLGAAFGAALGALSGSLADIGIDDNFINEVRAKVQPGTSALFVMTSDAVLDKVAAELKDLDMELIHANLADADEARLRELFGES